ncbi:MAG: response regulator [Deferribacterota bacterium]|nr:response regulator [Deferribacterota bacterium]
MKILLADDEFKLRKMIAIQLRKRGYIVLEASNGKKAVELAINERPDVIILDIKMPEMNGLEAYEKIKNSKNFDNIPIIILSAQNDKDSLDKIKKLNIGHHLYKPFSFTELVRVIKNVS